MVTLKQSDVELRVQSALIALGNGTAEDDLVEFKGAWKEPILAARQLAGSANQAAGELVFWVFGVDSSGGHVDLSSFDPADWWAQVMARFDQQQPELIAHRRVEIDTGRAVYAFVFSTDGAPYVVKASRPDDDRLEIPIRTATGTRSATRSQIMRMLAPTVHVPLLDVLKAFVVAYLPTGGEGMKVSGKIDVFFDYPANRDAVTLPAHLHTAVLHLGDTEPAWPLSLSIEEPREGRRAISALRTPPAGRGHNPVGVNYVDGGVTLMGPGVANLRVSGVPASPTTSVTGEVPTSWCRSARLELRLGLAGSSREVARTIELPAAMMGPSQATFGVPGVRWTTAPR